MAFDQILSHLITFQQSSNWPNYAPGTTADLPKTAAVVAS